MNNTLFEKLFDKDKPHQEYIIDVLNILTQQQSKLTWLENVDNAMTAVNFVKFLQKEHGIQFTSENVKNGILAYDKNLISRIPFINKISLFSDTGYVEFRGYHRDDGFIAISAKESYGADTLKEHSVPNDEDKIVIYNVISRLSRNNHSSPFEQANITFKIRIPIFVQRQTIRHRTARVNEISGRYTKLKNEMYMPTRERILDASVINKDTIDDLDAFVDNVWSLMGLAQDRTYEVYEELLRVVKPELARTVLPVGTFTEFYWNMDLNNLQRYFTLRLDPHAQYEIRQLANAILAITLERYPIAIGCFFFNKFLPTYLTKSPYDQLYS
jgi:thymidylate synthase (FAD)